MRMLCRAVTAAATCLALAVPASVAAASPPIPGLHLRDVISRLTAQGLTCSGGRRLEDTVPGWTCTRSTPAIAYSVVILGSGGPAIIRVDAQVTVFAGAVDPPARAFLGRLATLPYTGAQPVRARAWTRRYLGTRRHRAFGPAAYRLQTTRLARFLVITGRPPA